MRFGRDLRLQRRRRDLLPRRERRHREQPDRKQPRAERRRHLRLPGDRDGEEQPHRGIPAQRRIHRHEERRGHMRAVFHARPREQRDRGQHGVPVRRGDLRLLQRHRDLSRHHFFQRRLDGRRRDLHRALGARRGRGGHRRETYRRDRRAAFITSGRGST